MARAAAGLLIALPLLLAACAADPDRVRAAGQRRFEAAKRFYADEFRRQLDGALTAPGAAAPAAASPAPTKASSPPAAALPAATPVFSPPPLLVLAETPPPLSVPAATPPPAAPGLAPATALRSPLARPPAATPTPPRRLGAPRPEPAAAPVAMATPYPSGDDTADASASEEEAEGEEEQPPDADGEPPQLVSVNFVPPEARDGSEVRVIVATRDNLSGAASGSGSLVSPSGRVFIPFALTGTPEAAVLNGTFKVPPESEAGIWRLSSLRLTDRAQNANVIAPREHPVGSTVQLVVASGRTDNTAPMLDSIELQPGQVEDGGTVRVVVRAHDDKSEVATIRGILANPSRSVQLNFYPKLNPGSGAFEGTVALPRHSERGDWTTIVVTLTDSANNRATVSGEDERLKRARVAVVSTASDTTPPQLANLIVLPERVPQNGSIDVTIATQDDLSGVKGADGWVISPNAGARLHFPLTATAAPNEFHGRIAIPECAAVGRWRVERIALSDGSGNRSLITGATDPIMAGAGFEVYRSGTCEER